MGEWLDNWLVKTLLFLLCILAGVHILYGIQRVRQITRRFRKGDSDEKEEE